jgi:phosphoribosyl 1,2-cyclic phosphodiesterase
MNALGAEISIKEFTSDKIQIGPVTIEWQEQVCHPGGSVRYRLSAFGKRLVYATDVELDVMFVARKEEPEYQKLATQYEEFVSGVDLLIADGQYTEKEYLTNVGFGHTSIPVLVDIAYRKRVHQLAVFHHEPQHSDSMLDKLWTDYSPKYNSSDPPMNIFWAREGMTMAV